MNPQPPVLPADGRRIDGGFALLVTMVVISVASSLGIQALQSSSQEFRVATNVRGAARATAWAETGRAWGRKLMIENTNITNLVATTCDPPDRTTPYPTDDPKVDICLRQTTSEATQGQLTGSAASGSASLIGTARFVQVVVRTRLNTSAGNVIGYQEIESYERITRLE